MGNKIESPKIKQIILEISETTEINTTFLKSEFNNLFELIGNQIKSRKELERVVVEIILELNDESILNFLQNLVEFMYICKKENFINDDKRNTGKNHDNIYFSFHLMQLIIDSNSKNFHELILFSLENFYLNKFSNCVDFNDILLESDHRITSYDCEADTKNFMHINLTFPINIINICMEYYIELLEVLENLDFELLQIITNILSYFLNFNKCVLTNKNFVEFIDPFKFFFYIDRSFTQNLNTSQTVNSGKSFFNFINKLVFMFLKHVNEYFIDNKSERNECFILETFELLMWFCFDVNKFFFFRKNVGSDIMLGGENLKINPQSSFVIDPDKVDEQITQKENSNIEKVENEYFFENNFNEKVFKFLSDNYKFKLGMLSNIKTNPEIEIFFSPIQIVEDYNNLISETIHSTFLNNPNLFKDFVFNYFNNYWSNQKFNQRFKTCVKVFLIYLFESNLVKLKEYIFYY